MAKEQNSADGRGFDYREFEPKSPSPSEFNCAAFEEVLSETLNQESFLAMGADCLAGLSKVAQQYQGSKLTLDPIAVELVNCILRIRINRHGRLSSFGPVMSREIAESLYETPTSKERLVILWDALLGNCK